MTDFVEAPEANSADPFAGAPTFLQHTAPDPEVFARLSSSERQALRQQAMEDPRLAHPSNLEDLANVCQIFTSGTGCDRFLFGFFLPALGSQARFVINGYSEAWFKRYNEMGYIAFDPVVTRVMESATPFEWTELKITSKEVVDFFMDAAGHGVCSGFTVRASTFLNGQGALNFASANPNWCLGSERMQIFGEALLFAGRVADAVFGMLERLAEGRKRLLGLSARQLEVLNLASRGLQNKQIADKLNITVATTVFHLNKAMEHLGVTNRSGAISLLAQSGLVNSPRPSRLVSHSEYDPSHESAEPVLGIIGKSYD